MAHTSPQAKSPVQPLRSLALSLFAVSLLATPSHAKAQSETITLATPASHEQIQNWLESGDPRLIAWGAHFAREQNDQSALASIPPLIARQMLGPSNLATMVMLDALIQRGQTVPANTLAIIASAFPSQAAILIARLPLPDSTPLLLDWYSHRTDKNPTVLPRIAAMLLSHAPPLGFPASVVAESEESLFLTVTTPGSNPPSGFGSASCGDGPGSPPPAGWPPLFTYAIEENIQQPAWSDIVKAGGDRIGFLRHDLSKGWGFCNGNYPAPLNAWNRHFLLAQMLGSTHNEITWEVTTTESIDWKSDTQFLHDAKAKVAFEEKKLRMTDSDLQAIGLLTAEEAAIVRTKLTVTIWDARNPARHPLPQLRFADPRTVVVTAYAP